MIVCEIERPGLGAASGGYWVQIEGFASSGVQLA